MDIVTERPSLWSSGSTDVWLSLLIGLLTAISLSHIPSGIAAALLVHMVLKYAEDRAYRIEARDREAMVRIPVRALQGSAVLDFIYAKNRPASLV